MREYTDYDGSWYDMLVASLEHRKKQTEDWTTGKIVGESVGRLPIIDPKTCKIVTVERTLVPVPKEECWMEMWDIRTLQAKGARKKLFQDGV